MDAHHRRIAFKSWTRTLHIYISMFGLLAVIFFSVTGIMLNHEEWFGYATPRIVTRKGTIPEATSHEPDRLAIVEKLRADFGVTGAMDSFEVEEDQLRVVFKSPGRRAEATLQRGDGGTEVEFESHGFAGRLVELHRGTDAGTPWRWAVIDGTAIILLLTSITGLVLWCFVPRWRKFGVAGLTACVLICGLVYLALVP